MSKLIVVTISDDRFGRKGGLYSETQQKIKHIIENNPQLGIDGVQSWQWNDVAATEWYQENRVMLDNLDAARNGRAYKPFVILEALKSVEEGDYVVYTDCSPEMWKMDWNTIFPAMYYNSDVIKRLTNANNNILSVFIKWDRVDIPSGALGIHTHRYFTLNRCMDRMGMRQYEDYYMCASGMWCIKKTKETMAFVEEWLKWNCDEECASLGRVAIADDYSFWVEEGHAEEGKEGNKLGHRHDQSIASLLLNRRDAKFVDILHNDMNPYNFLQFMKTDVGYKFISGTPEKRTINIGDVVTNDRGVELNVYRIENGMYVVGKSLGSCYATTVDKLKLKI